MFQSLPVEHQVTFGGIVQEILNLIKEYGPEARPLIEKLIADSNLPAWTKTVLKDLADSLLTPQTP